MLRRNRTDIKIWNENFKDDTINIVERNTVEKIEQIQVKKERK